MNIVRINPLSLKRVFRRGIVLSTVLVLFPLFDVIAGVLVAPPVVFISEKGRTGRLTVQNPTDAPKEISISFSFGIPESDSLGNIRIDLQDTAVTDPRSSLGWIKAFPRKLVIPANGSQVVRFVANPPKDLVDGEYWSRVVVQSQEGATSMPTPGAEDKITTKLNMIMRTAVMLKYRTGDLVAAIDVNRTDVQVVDSTVEVLIDMTNKGNCSYIGMLATRLVDADGSEISKSEIQLAVYRDLTRKMKLPIPSSGFRKPYKVEVSISNKGRKDIPQEEMVYGNEISRVMTVEG